MFFRCANSIEGRGTWFFRIGCVEFRHKESSGHRPHLLVWEPKITKNLSFFGFFVNFS
jgi:hypothetical protein